MEYGCRSSLKTLAFRKQISTSIYSSRCSDKQGTHCLGYLRCSWNTSKYSYPGTVGSGIPVSFQLSSHHCIRQPFKFHAWFWAGIWFQSRNHMAIMPGVRKPRRCVPLTVECGFVFIATLLSWGRQHKCSIFVSLPTLLYIKTEMFSVFLILWYNSQNKEFCHVNTLLLVLVERCKP